MQRLQLNSLKNSRLALGNRSAILSLLELAQHLRSILMVREAVILLMGADGRLDRKQLPQKPLILDNNLPILFYPTNGPINNHAIPQPIAIIRSRSPNSRKIFQFAQNLSILPQYLIRTFYNI